LQREGLFKVLKAQRFFAKPSLKRKLKSEEATSRYKKLARKKYAEDQG
jgi:ribosomal protein S21